jgi:hypothetical protein
LPYSANDPDALPFSLVYALLVISSIREVSVTISLLIRTFNRCLSD